MKPTDYFRTVRSDKASLYPSFYDLAITSLLFEADAIRVLEIGCTDMLNRLGSGSSNAFSKMPFVKKYVGIDTLPPKNDFGEKATFIQGDAYSKEVVAKVESLNEKFHLVIDDGPHTPKSQITFFKLYEQFCAERAIMICEDVLLKPDEEIYQNEVFNSLNDPEILIVRHPYMEQKVLAHGNVNKKNKINLLVKTKF